MQNFAQTSNLDAYIKKTCPDQKLAVYRDEKTQWAWSKGATSIFRILHIFWHLKIFNKFTKFLYKTMLPGCRVIDSGQCPKILGKNFFLKNVTNC